MAYHADYWMLAGTTASVLALSAVVSMTDAYRQGWFSPSRRGGLVGMLQTFAATLLTGSVVFGLTVLVRALDSVAAGRDVHSVLMTSSIFYLALWSFVIGVILRTAEKVLSRNAQRRGRALKSDSDGEAAPEQT